MPASFVIKAEIILNRDRGERLRFALDRDAFLGFDRLVQTIAPAAARHQTAGVFIDDDDLVFLDDVLHVLLIKAVGLEQLRDGVDALRLGFEFLLQLGLRFQPLARIGFRPGIDLVQRRRQIRQHERIRIFRAQKIAALFGQIGFMALFIHGEKEFLRRRCSAPCWARGPGGAARGRGGRARAARSTIPMSCG